MSSPYPKMMQWRECTQCRARLYRNTGYVGVFSRGDLNGDVWRAYSEWHRQIEREMWDEYQEVSMDHQLPEVPGEWLPRAFR